MNDVTVTQEDRDAYNCLMEDEAYDHEPAGAWHFARHRTQALTTARTQALTTARAEAEAKDAEIARLRKALVVLRDLPISESDSPDTLHLHGEAYTGPAVDWLFRIVRKIKQIAATALASEPQQ